MRQGGNMKVSYLAERTEWSHIIADWYFNEWGYISPELTKDIILANVLEKSKSTTEFPLSIIVTENNSLAGVAELKLRENVTYPEYEYWVGGIFVSSEFRGQGLSSILINKAKDHTFKLGINKLYLQCEKHNVNLYSKHGFQALHHAKHRNVETTIMVCESSA